MIRMILSGCSGAMGRTIVRCAADRTECEIVAGIDIHAPSDYTFPIFSTPNQINTEADVLIDFSNPSLLSSLLEFGLRLHLPLVLCATGYSADQVQSIKQAAHRIPVFYSGNMSLGINLLISLAQKAAQILGQEFDIEIVEKHHNKKLDAPSGTALMLADAISSVEPTEMRYIYDRHSQRKKRDPSEIGLHSVRGGSIVGEHEVIFAGPQEVITLSHSAQSKDIFANGALSAAAYLAGKPAGLYQMSDLL